MSSLGIAVARSDEEKEIIERVVDDLSPKSAQELLYEEVHDIIEGITRNMIGAKSTPALRARIRREVIEAVEHLLGRELAEKIEVQEDPQDRSHLLVSVPSPPIEHVQVTYDPHRSRDQETDK